MLSYFNYKYGISPTDYSSTDVPLPFLTYSKGILALFLMLYLFVVVFNFNYIKYIKEK